MARERPTASPRSALTVLDGGEHVADTSRAPRAEAHALPHSAPDTHARLAEHFEPLRSSEHRQLRGIGQDLQTTEACIHTVFRSATGNWANQISSGERVYGVYATKEECVRRGQEIARAAGVNHVIHDVDGAVSSLDRPRRDPRSP